MKKYNLSYLEVSLEDQLENWDNSQLVRNMWLTAQPLYKNIDIEFNKIIDIVKSDYRQYSPFEFADNKKISENWSNDKQDLLILDIDDGLSITEAKEIFKKCKYLISTTKSHQVEKKGLKCDRFRIILSAINIPRGDEYFKFIKMIEEKYHFIDKQVNTKTGAFLGSYKCEYWYNEGKEFDCNIIININKRLEKFKTIQEPTKTQHQSNRNIPKTNSYSHNEQIDIAKIKSFLSRELVADIVSSCGYEVNAKFMFRYRQEERTPSTSISKDLLIKDFGSELCTDIIGFVQEVKGINFIESVNYVKTYL